MEIQKTKQGYLIVVSALIFACNLSVWTVHAQVSIPAKFDGFFYENRLARADTIMIEAFFDPVCPDSRDAWPSLKQVLEYHGSRLSLVVHPFALPYHDNAFVSCRALHIVNNLNTSATYYMLEQFFKHQINNLSDSPTLSNQNCHKKENFYNQPTREMSRVSIVDHIVKFVTEAIGNSSLPAVESGFNDTNTDLTTRVSFKYGCSRGVTGTPYFFVNGFPLPNGGSAIEYNVWRSIIDPLVSA